MNKYDKITFKTTKLKASTKLAKAIFYQAHSTVVIISIALVFASVLPHTTASEPTIEKNPNMLQLGTQFPNFKAASTIGEIDFHTWLGNSWGILFSHPADFTPVCTTELARMAALVPEFEKRNVKVIALSLDSVQNHVDWIKDIEAYGKLPAGNFPYPIIADENRELSVMLNMLDQDEKNKEGLPMTARSVFIIDSNKKFRLSILYPATTGRNFDEILRVVDSLQLTDKHSIATPVDWKAGGDVMIQPCVSLEDATKKFPNAKVIQLPSGKPYMRETAQP